MSVHPENMNSPSVEQIINALPSLSNYEFYVVLDSLGKKARTRKLDAKNPADERRWSQTDQRLFDAAMSCPTS